MIDRNDENKLKQKLPNSASWDNDIETDVVRCCCILS